MGLHRTRAWVTEDGATVVRYYDVNVVMFAQGTVILESGDKQTTTTKKRMNQISEQFRLGFRVYAKNGQWFVDTQKQKAVPFANGMCFKYTREKGA